ncbi:putative ribonuclease H-like domain-containing protein [Tanacetum coccineum]
MVPRTVLTKSGLISLNTTRPVNTVQSRTTVNNAGPMKNVINNAYSTARRPFNKITATNNSNFTKKVNTARPKAVLSAVKRNRGNAVKASACWVWRPKHKVLDHGNPQQDLRDKGVIDSGCSRHMTGNKSYLTDYEEIDRGFVAFRGNSKGGKITGKGKIRTGKLDFEDVYFVKELKFNLFSVSKMCDKKNNVLFTDTACVVLSLDFKLTDKSHVLLKFPRKDNMYSEKMKDGTEETGKEGEVNAVDPKKTSIKLPNDLNMPELEDIVYLDNDEDVGAEADMNNLDAFMLVSPIPTTRIHKIIQNKKDERGLVIKNKARFAAQGYTQEKGIDYDEVFAHISRIEAIRLFLDYASFKDFVVYQMVFMSAFLYGKIERKSMFVQHQRGKIDKTLFIRRDKGDILLVQVYVDDIIFGSTKKSLCTEFEKMMHKKFQMSSMGELTFFLGLRVKQKEDGILISQDKYVTKILKKFGFSLMQTANTPWKPIALLKDAEVKDVDEHLYRSRIGSLMYLTSSRPDIMFAVCQPKLGLWYPKDSPFDLVAYTDSDYAGASLDRKSTIGGEVHCVNMQRIIHKGWLKWNAKAAKDGIGVKTGNSRVNAAGHYLVLLGKKNADFAEIIDFLNANPIRYALTVSLTIYVTCIEQFWSTAKTKTVNNETQIHAKVEGKTIVISESSVRRDLQFDDEDGIACLTKTEIFENLQLMGYEKLSEKLTFYKPYFSPQWKYLIHTILQCLSSKSTAWNKFGTNIASAVICLAKNQKFNFSKLIFDGMMRNLDSSKKFLMYPRFLHLFLNKQIENLSEVNDVYDTHSHTKKIFANMRRQGKDFLRTVTPLFSSMLAQQADMGEGSGKPTDPQHTSTSAQPSNEEPITVPSLSQPKKTHRPRKAKRATKISQSSGLILLVADEIVTKEREDRIERATTTASSLKQSRTVSNDPPLSRFNTLGNGEDRLKLKELVDLCTKLSNRVLDLETTKTAQAKEIASLKKRVKKLERKRKSKTLGMNLFKIGTSRRRSLGEVISAAADEVPTDDAVNTASTKVNTASAPVTTTGVSISTAEPITTASVNITTAEQITPPTTIIIFEDEDLTIAQTLVKMRSEKLKVRGVVMQEPSETATRKIVPPQQHDPKDKGKGKMVEQEKPLKKKDQIKFDEEIAQRLQAQMQAELEEEERLAREREEDANIAEWDNAQSMMDADYELAARI